ncbi:MAG: glycosyltransferase, partial [Patescibacteria group bacterium]
MAKLDFIAANPKSSLVSRVFASKSNLIAVCAHDATYHGDTIAQLQKLAVSFTIAVTRPTGLIVFHREILDHLDPKKLTPDNFFAQLLHTASELGYAKAVHHTGLKRHSWSWSVRHFLRQMHLRFSPHKFYLLSPSLTATMMGAGMAYKRRRFTTHTTLSHHQSAVFTFSSSQKAGIFAAFAVALVGFYFSTLYTGIVIVGLLSIIYFSDVCFSFYLVLKSLHFPPELDFSSEQVKALSDPELPIYTILCPLYKEANVLPHFLDSVASLDWPKDKLDVQLLLEEDDAETIAVARSLDLPKYIHVVVVPDSQPKTKPKACNYGLHHAKGEFVVVYDAEDRPDPLQLKKAYLAFKESSDKVACVQAKLNYYNPHQNLLTRFFTAEYSLWFDVVLPGLQSISTTIPLGGTSNHFQTKVLK